MAIVILALNGIGLGHLSRASVIAEVLASRNRRPVIISQGVYPPHLAGRFPGTTIPRISTAPPEARASIAHQISSLALLTRPAVVFEDTHPARMELPAVIRRALVVRPTTFTYLRDLKEHYAQGFSICFLADDPGSPVWPYTSEQTREIATWDNWRVIGPVFRAGSSAGLARVRMDYGMRPDTPAYVFTMGGGGQQKEGSQDVAVFLTQAVSIAEHLRRAQPSCRLLFVRGPFFPATVELPNLFESIAEEPRMPDLLASAAGAVIRPGLNTIWECVQAGTPFLAIRGTTFQEPVQERLSALQRNGLLCEDPAFLSDAEWSRHFRVRCAHVMQRWSGKPNPRVFDAICEPLPRITSPFRSSSPADDDGEMALWREWRGRLEKSGLSGTLLVRIDDVTSLSEEVLILIEWCHRFRLYASLEIIPYFCDFNELVLAELDRERRLEVSQHGYAHIPSCDRLGRRGEFLGRPGSEPSPIDLRQIEWGRSTLLQLFPSRFKGGYSPPFDGLPPWLPTAWQKIGGSYLSVIWDEVLRPPLPVVRIRVEPWDWKRTCFRPADDIREEIIRSIQRDGQVGLVIHPQLLVHPSDRAKFLQILSTLASCLRSARVSEGVGTSLALK